ncbi:hypothetical protein AURDEDRAFT_185760 [Auricularia subglabra TFB-10046 SS5]|nr:hypothetical protein AURDEDRAFT_185760 [Auricularia subglabra TFB-10046 SS5]
MDELLSHCLREISFDGDFGCDVSRLSTFISGFYARGTSQQQTVDDAFRAYVWTLVTAQPNVRVGLMPEGVTTEVAIPKRTVDKRRRKDAIPEEMPTLKVIEEAKTMTLPQLIAAYGNNLRIAVDEMTCFKTITGSHIRAPKLSPMVYSCLQLICRGREYGMSIHHLGQTTGYDQKTCHYIAAQLLSLDLVVKIPKPGIGSHFCVHKYFYRNSPVWQRTHAEELDPMLGAVRENPELDDTESDSGVDGLGWTFRTMDIIDHSSDQLFRARVVALLKAIPEHEILQSQLLSTCGVGSRDKTLRRFFQPRVDAMLNQGIIEPVQNPHPRKAHATQAYYRLVNTMDEMEYTIESSSSPRPGGADDAALPPDKMLAGNVTLQKQMIDMLEDSGTRGMTLREIRGRMGDYDRRTLELMLSRLSESRPPPHLADIGVKTVIESFGRERRYRYYTTRAYATIMSTEQIQQPTSDHVPADADSDLPEFSPASAEEFYQDQDALGAFVREHASSNALKPGKPGRPKKYKSENPRDANGIKVKGRPRKEWAAPKEPGQAGQAATTPAKPARKRKRADVEDDAEGAAEDTRPKKRGRATSRKDAAAEGDAETKPKRPVRQPRKKAQVAAEEPEAADIEKTDELLDAAANNTVDIEKEAGPSTTQTNASQLAGREPPFPLVPMVMDPSTPAGQGETVSEGLLMAATVARAPQQPVLPPPSLDTTQPDSEAPVGAQPAQDEVEIVPESPKEMVLIGSSTTSPSTSKRPLPPDLTSSEPRRKRPRTEDRPRPALELSRLRRENEFVKLAEANGGFVCVSAIKLFKQKYINLLEEMVARGEAISGARGVAPDSKTTLKTLDALEAKGRIKVLETFMATASGVQIKAKVYHLIDLPEDRVNRELTALSATLVAPMHGLGEVLPVPPSDGMQAQLMDLRGNANNKTVLGELVTADGEAARGSFLTEKSTYWQIYGYLMGRYARARELHLFTLSQLAADQPAPSKHFVSRTDRVVALAYYFNDLPLGTYCSLVSVPAYSEVLELALRTVEGVHTPMWCLPRELSTFLETGRQRARGQVTSLFNMLVGLDLVVPLAPATEEDAVLVCEPTPESIHPIYYKPYVSQKDQKVTAPLYYQFKTAAPMFRYGNKEFPPPFVGERSVLNADVSMAFWRELRTVSLSLPVVEQADTTQAPLKCTLEEFKRVKSPGSWVDYYVMTWYQKEYLRSHITPTGDTPWDDPNPLKPTFARVCHVSCVPMQVAQVFYMRERDNYLRARTLIMKRTERRRESRKLKAPENGATPAEAAAASDEERRTRYKTKAKKYKRRDPAMMARMRREADWDDVLSKVHPEPMDESLAEAMQLLKDHYLENAGLTKVKLHIEMRLTIEKHNQKVAQAALPSHNGQTIPLVPQTAQADTTPVQELVSIIRSKTAALGLSKKKAVPPSKQRKKGKSKAAEEAAAAPAEGEEQPSIGDDGRQRRRRFAWNAQFDELARDAGCIIRVRCSGTRMDWAAAEKVFPGLSRVAIRTRIVNLRDAPGGESYFTRLDEAWRALWLAHRGSEALPDPNTNSTSDFPIIEHIEFLRKYVDKQALRMGVNLATASSAPNKEGQDTTAHQQPLLRDVGAYMRTWHIEEKPRPAPAMREFMWGGLSDEQRERESLREPYTVDSWAPFPAAAPPAQQEFPDDVVEAALKMMLSTPDETYDEDLGVALLKAFGDGATERAAVSLLERNVVSHTLWDRDKIRPGRTLKIAEPHEAMLGGWLSAELALDAVALDNAVAREEDQDEWREWSATATDGDTAAFLRMVVNDEVDVDIDLVNYAAARESLDWNSRKVDDGQIEGVVSWRCKRKPGQVSKDVEMSEADALDLDASSEQHGLTAAQAPACCHVTVQDAAVVVDCAKCLEQSLAARMRAAPNDTVRDLLAALVQGAEAAGWRGLTRAELSSSTVQFPTELVRRLTSGPVALLFWTGYDNARLVHTNFTGHWTVQLGGDSDDAPLRKLLPRRWIDIRGRVIEDVWNAAVRAVSGLVQLRPGVTQADVRAKLVTLYDRQEVNAILDYLVKGPALVVAETGKTYNYPALRALVLEFRDLLRSQLGVGTADVVASSFLNGIEFVVSFLGTGAARAIAAPLNPAYTTKEYEFYLEDTKPVVLLLPRVGADHPALAAARSHKVRVVSVWIDDNGIHLKQLLDGKPISRKPSEGEPRPDDVALVLHTSGTTGRPKSVPLSHHNLLTTTRNIVNTYNLDKNDRTYLVMPLFHVHGLLAGLLAPFRSKGSVVVPQKFSAARFWSDFTKYQCNWYTAVPTIHSILLNTPRPSPLPQIRFIRSCSSSLAPSTFAKLEATFKAPVLEAYAMTEARSPSAAHQMTSNVVSNRVPGTVGQGVGVEISVRDTSTGEEVPRGQTGEVCVRGENVTKGYWANEKANKESFWPGRWFRTGDQGRIHESGNIQLTGRLKELINRGGEKISPLEIDSALLACEGVGEAVCFGVEDAKYGEIVWAGVVLKGDSMGSPKEEQRLKKELESKLAKFKIPERIIFTKTIPKTATGKIQRRHVRDAFVAQVKEQPAKAKL